MSYLNNINTFLEDNLGSLLEIKVIRSVDISSIPEPVGETIYGDIILKAGKAWTTWNVTKNVVRHRAAGKSSMEGEYERNSLTFIIPKDRQEIRQMLHLTRQDNLVVLYKDANATWKIFGTLTDPARFKFSHDTGASTTNRNSYSCEFYAEGPGNNYFYKGSISTPPASAAPAIVKKSDGTVLASLSPGQTFIITSGFSFGYRIE